jgi:tetratricopeptide (TPR) repeat protein
LFTTAEVARIFGLKENRLRYWAQTGFVNPSSPGRGRRLYTFRDLVAIRAAKELLDRGIPLQRVRKNLRALREALPQLEQPLSQLRVRSDGENLVVSHGNGSFEPETGQMMLDFRIDAVGTQAAQILKLSAPHPGPGPEPEELDSGTIHATPAGAPDLQQPSTAYGWFMRGCALEGDEQTVDRALEAFAKAIDLDPGLASAWTNLGNLHYYRGDRDEAQRCYEQACALDPDQPEAQYNLANLLEEEGDLDVAISGYRRVLRLDPGFRDAHFNLALTLERVGSRVQAMEHWRLYLELAENIDIPAEEEWIELAREHLQQLDEGEG